MTTSTIVNVPAEFCFQDPFFYPSDNEIDFEYWLSMNIKEGDIKGDRQYLPITWTSYYKFHQYGEDINAINKLQKFLVRLDRSKKYFTIVQFDLGILNDVSGLDIKVFSMAGKPMDYPLPLIAQPHSYVPINMTRDITACFVGANTHPIREEIYKLDDCVGFYCQKGKHTLETYCSILSNSVFSLCPRGFSAASFRCQESLQYGSIPIYVSDKFIEPHYIPFSSYGIKIRPDQIKWIPQMISSLKQEEIEYLRKNGKEVYSYFYTFESNKKLILKNLENA